MDGSAIREAVRALNDAGFRPVRQTTHGVLWREGQRTILVPRKTKNSDPRAFRNMQADLRRLGVSV